MTVPRSPASRPALLPGLLAALTACAAPAASAPRDEAPIGADSAAAAPTGEATIRAEDLAAHVALLASDAFDGRFPGTPGEAKTVAYLSARLARAGVEPAVGGSYLQAVPLAAVTPDERSRLELHAADGARLVLDFPDEVLLSGPTTGRRRELVDSPLVFAGYGIVAPEYGWDDYAGRDVAGRTVVVLWGDPGVTRDDPAFFRGRALTHHGTLTGKIEEATRQGAAAVLVAHDEQASVPFGLLADHARKTSYRLAGSGDEPARPITGTLREDAARRLFALAGADLDAGREEAARDGFRARDLDTRARFDVSAGSRPVVSHNVVGVLPGRTRPDEYVLYTAHWDHVGTQADLDEDPIFNGAVDNATGTAALLELAEAFGSLPERPERSIVFVGTTSEEQGLLGARHYVEHPLFPLEQTVAVINMDALFPFGETKGMTVVALGSSEIEEYMATATEAVGRRLYPDPAPELGAFFRSDHYPFASKGVPAIFAVGGPAGDPAAGETVDIQRYVDYGSRRYHQPSDEYDAETWDMAGIVQDVRIFFGTGLAIACDTRFPNWYPDHEFRARRDAMRAAEGG